MSRVLTDPNNNPSEYQQRFPYISNIRPWYQVSPHNELVVKYSCGTDLGDGVTKAIFSARYLHNFVMTLSNGNIFRVTGHLSGEFIGHR